MTSVFCQKTRHVRSARSKENVAGGANSIFVHAVHDRLILRDPRQHRFGVAPSGTEVLSVEAVRRSNKTGHAFVHGHPRAAVIYQRRVNNVIDRVALLLALSLGSRRKGTERGKGNHQSSHHPLPLDIDGLQPSRVRCCEQAGAA